MKIVWKKPDLISNVSDGGGGSDVAVEPPGVSAEQVMSGIVGSPARICRFGSSLIFRQLAYLMYNDLTRGKSPRLRFHDAVAEWRDVPRFQRSLGSGTNPDGEDAS